MAKNADSPGLNFWGALSNIGTAAANALVLTRAIDSGRAPGAEVWTNPTTPAKGNAGQPGTTPEVTAPWWQPLMPWILGGAALLGGALLIKLALRK